MDAVVYSDGCVSAGDESALTARAFHVVNVDGARSLTEEGKEESHGSCGVVAQLATHDLCVLRSPEVVANRAPGFTVAELHTTFVRSGSTSQSDVSIGTQT